MPIYRTKITYVFTGTIDIEAKDEIDAEDKIRRVPVSLDIDTSEIKTTLYNAVPTNERILVINKIKD